MRALPFALVALLLPQLAWAQEASAPQESQLVSLLLVFGIPLLLVAASAFAKVTVVLGLLRNAFGSNEVPPALVSSALAVVLSVIILAPVMQESADRWGDAPLRVETAAEAVSAWHRVAPPIEAFLDHNSDPETRERFDELLSSRLDTAQPAGRMAVLLPSYMVTELTEAFALGLLLLLPFIVLDLVVAAILQAAGLGAVQPHVVALPLKLLLFVSIDGWRLLIEALLASYV